MIAAANDTSPWAEPFEDKAARKLWCRHARRHAKLSASTLAEALDISEALVRQWEAVRQGSSAPNAHRLQQIAQRTGYALPPHWRIANLRPEQRDLRRSRAPRTMPEQRSATSVADEILAIGERLGSLGGNEANAVRNAKIFAQRYGAGGAHASTLQACGDHYGMTRERVRQIQQKMLERAAMLGVRFDGSCTRALAAAIEAAPTGPLEEAETRLRSLLGPNLSLLDARRFANEVLAVALPFLVIPVQVTKPVGAEALLFVPGERPEYVEEAVSQAKRLIRHSGAANTALTWSLTQQACPDVVINPTQLRAVLRTLPGFGWLDEHESWFWFGPEGSSNRVVARAVEILAVADAFVDVEEIYAGIVRYDRERQPQASEFAGVIAPLGVVTRLFRASPEFVTQQSDDFALAVPVRVEDVLSDSTLELYRYMHARGGIASRNELVAHFVRTGLMNPITLSVGLAISPTIRQIDRGLYALRGRALSPDRFGEATRRVGVPLDANAKPTPFGTKDVRVLGDGTLEWDVILTAGALRNRMSHIPSTARKLLRSGDYSLGDGHALRISAERSDLLRGLVQSAVRCRHVVGDHLTVRLNSVAMTASLKRSGTEVQLHHDAVARQEPEGATREAPGHSGDFPSSPL